MQTRDPQSATSAWHTLIDNLRRYGQASSPRNQQTKELLGYSSCVDMSQPVVQSLPRKLNYTFMAAEAWWILDGRNDAASIGKYCKNIVQFADIETPNGLEFFGAYGPKISRQFQHVVNSLRADPDSRQAVISIWRESPPKTRDVPCTISAQWLIRDNRLICIDTMRSSDAWLGWPYDVFNFSMLSWEILNQLRDLYPDLKLGYLILNAGSQHLYARDELKMSSWPDFVRDPDFFLASDPMVTPAGEELNHGGVKRELERVINYGTHASPFSGFFSDFNTQLVLNSK